VRFGSQSIDFPVACTALLPMVGAACRFATEFRHLTRLDDVAHDASVGSFQKIEEAA
jgi:hypothetical protein